MRFFALDLAIDIIRQLRPLERTLRIHNRKLANQMSEASSSIALNLGEGNRRWGRDRKHLFSIASGSTEEVRTALRVAVARGELQEQKAAQVLADIDHLQAILWKLTR